MCDDCQTSIFNYHFICLFCGHITCITCGEKHFTFKSMTGVSTKTKRNISCKSCSETERFRKSDEKPRDCMLPISLIPIDAIHHLYEILKYVMKVRFIISIYVHSIKSPFSSPYKNIRNYIGSKMDFWWTAIVYRLTHTVRLIWPIYGSYYMGQDMTETV